MTQYILSLITLLIATTGLRAESAQPRMKARVTASPASLALGEPVQVKLRLEGAREGACLYVPAQDQELHRLLLLESVQKGRPQDKAKRQEFDVRWTERAGLVHVGPALYRIPSNAPLDLSYELDLGGWLDRPEAPRLLALWHPVVLKTCPAAHHLAFTEIAETVDFELSVEAPSDWKFGAVGETQSGVTRYRGTQLNGVFFKHGTLRRHTFDGMTLLSLSLSESFEELLSFARQSLSSFKKWTDFSGEPGLLLVETEDFESIRAPGLVTLNRPQQPGMRKLQQDFTHWNAWQLVTLLAQQWFGIGCRAATLEDHWLMQGLADHLVLMSLSEQKDYFELFSKAGDGKPWLNLNYRQAQDLAASAYSLMSSEVSLMKDAESSHASNLDRPFLFYVRNSVSQRYLQWKLGQSRYLELLRQVGRQCQQESMTPKAFLTILKAEEPDAARVMEAYWTSNEWPDVALGGTEVENGQTIVKVTYQNDLLLPVDLWITDKKGRREVVFIEPRSREVRVPIATRESRIKKLELNPSRAFFDRDRFNNKSGFPKINFFPGSARGLEDDAYTLLWIPMVNQLPGEPFSVQLGLQALRYLTAGLTGMVRWVPEDDRVGFNMVYLKAMPHYDLNLIAKIRQDDERTERGERRMDFSLQQRTLFDLLPRSSGSFRLRSKQQLGQPKQNHFTTGVNLTHKGPTARACSYGMETEVETSAYVPSGDFSYTRSLGSLQGGCESKYIGFGLRLFAGASRTRGDVPKTARFRPQNLDEAHVRLDKPSLPSSTRLASYNFDLSWPAFLPLPESWFVLPRRSQFKLFADGVRTQDEDHNATVAGLGYSLPLGGDIAGRDTVTVLKLSINAVFYRRLDGKVDQKPGILFDFSGNL